MNITFRSIDRWPNTLTKHREGPTMSAAQHELCARCGLPTVRAQQVGTGGHLIALDREPAADGNAIVVDDAEPDAASAELLDNDQAELAHHRGVVLYMPHDVTCEGRPPYQLTDHLADMPASTDNRPQPQRALDVPGGTTMPDTSTSQTCPECGRVCGNTTGLAQHRKFKHPETFIPKSAIVKKERAAATEPEADDADTPDETSSRDDDMYAMTVLLEADEAATIDALAFLDDRNADEILAEIVTGGLDALGDAPDVKMLLKIRRHR